jgi:hypothetical protein
MSDIEKFFTRQKANEGIVLPLTLPDGTPTEHSITIYGVDSDSYRTEEAESKRKAFEIAASGDRAAASIMIRDGRVTLVASMVKSWTMDLPCTKENVVRLLQEAPQITDAIDRLASDRRSFFKPSLNSSTPTPGQSSGLPSQ